MMASAGLPPAVGDAAGLLSAPDDALIARMEKGECTAPRLMTSHLLELAFVGVFFLV